MSEDIHHVTSLYTDGQQTNWVGTFDDAFKSRIHISLQYETLSKKTAMKIWENNIRRAKGHYEVEEVKILMFAEKNFEGLRWKGRQIKYAFQAAITLAEYDAHSDRSTSLKQKTLMQEN